MEVNINKTKVITFGSKSQKNNIKLNGKEAETVNQFIYLGILLSAGGCEKEIKRRTALAYGALAGFEKVWKSNEISVSTKYFIPHACVLIYFYTLQKEEIRRLEAFEMGYNQRILGVSWQERIRNTEILEKSQPRS